MPSDRREQILRAAGELFATRGFDDVTVQQVCARARIGNGSFFYVFSSKQALAAELYDEACQRRNREVAAVLEATSDDPERAIKAAIIQVATFMASGRLESLHLRRLRDAVSSDPRFKRDRDGLGGLITLLAGWIERPAVAKAIGAPSPLLIAVLLLAPVRALSEFGDGSPPGEMGEMVDFLSERIWAALRTTPAERQRPPNPRTLHPPKQADELDLFSQPAPVGAVGQDALPFAAPLPSGRKSASRTKRAP